MSDYYEVHETSPGGLKGYRAKRIWAVSDGERWYAACCEKWIAEKIACLLNEDAAMHAADIRAKGLA